MGRRKKEEKEDSDEKEDTNKVLIDNFITLQKVMTNLSLKFDELSDNISKLLQLFEISAKTFAEKSKESELNIQKELAQKVDALLDQNKIISKGIMLMEERIREKEGIKDSGSMQNEQMQNKPMQHSIDYSNPDTQEPSGLRGIFKSKPLPKY